ncbi:MAG: hypothetical protein P1P84_07965 [Deferrisomatales bacterium]|nr:hypothetical protein [Deferrisomatales bacterium]
MGVAMDVVVLKTGKLYEADLVANTFDDEGIPYYRRYTSSSGIELAMPLSPVQGPGDGWLIKVPAAHADRATAAIDRLPVTREVNPGVWDFGPSPRGRRIFRAYAWLSLAVLAIVSAHYLWALFAR